jgi:acetylornithine deacetylase/succinyl-diaminopimelate desuccinylase-like protein
MAGRGMSRDAGPQNAARHPGTQAALAHYEQNRADVLETLKAIARIPSVSFPGYDPENVRRSARAAADWLRDAGLHAEIWELPDTYPCAYAEWLGAPGKPTVLLYAHHDVQPPMREELWNSPPFEPTERDGRLYGRGTADDKAGLAVHAASIAAWLKTADTLPVNVKVLIEGEEEIGSPNLSAYLTHYKNRLSCDVMVLTDCANYDVGKPSLTTSLRGLVTLDVTVSALKSPLHSGMWGGPLPDPVAGLCKMLATLTDERGRVAVPGLLEQVVPPTEAELADFRALGMNETIFREQSGVLPGVELFAADESLLTRLWREPSFSINALEAGRRASAGNVLLDSAWARVGLRLVPDMDPELCTRLIVEHLKKVCPWGLQVDVVPDQGAKPWKTHPDHPVFEIAKKSLGAGYQNEAVCIGCGGTIPFVDQFTAVLGDVPALLVGIEDPYTNAHSENESLHLGDFDKAVRSQIHFFADLAEWNGGRGSGAGG